MSGGPNVGKSTLFNAIIGQRRSIVGDEPGITRDRIYGEATYRGRKFELIDTGGIIPNDDEMIPTADPEAGAVAFEEAAHVIFLIDGRSEDHGRRPRSGAHAAPAGEAGVGGSEQDRQSQARGADARVSLAGIQASVSGVGGASPGIRRPARSRDRGVPAEPRQKEAARAGARPSRSRKKSAALPIKVAIIGRPNVGKSTLLNALTGTERAIVSPVAGTTRDAVDEVVSDDGVDYVFVDTAGIRRKGKTKLMAEKLSVVMARRHLRMSHVALLVMDATEGVLALDATIAGYAHEEGRAVILCVNKWDAVEGSRTRAIHRGVRDDLKFLDYAPIAFVSAEKRLGNARTVPLDQEGLRIRLATITTGELNRFVERSTGNTT